MIVVIGSPGARPTPAGLHAAGTAAAIARAAAAADGAVQIVGRVGDDSAGDAVLLDLAAAGVEHVAVLRTGGATTPRAAAPFDSSDDNPLLGAVLGEGAGEAAATWSAGVGLPLDADDLELALRYLPDYRVIVVAPGLDPAALATVTAAAGWAGAHLIVVVDRGALAPDLPPDATVLERPDDDAVEAFASVVARYAVELDQGTEPAAAFAAASSGAGWSTVAD